MIDGLFFVVVESDGYNVVILGCCGWFFCWCSFGWFNSIFFRVVRYECLKFFVGNNVIVR